jgi:hypothetical protein
LRQRRILSAAESARPVGRRLMQASIPRDA